MSVTPEIHVSRDVQECVRKAAAFILAVSEQAIQSTGRCLVALSGGSTPRSLYRTLREPDWSVRFNWSRIFFLFGDERCTPPEHPESNFGMAQTELFQPLNVRTDHISRMKGEYEDPMAAAQEYEETIRRLIQCPVPDLPRLDLILLGLGEDGHTASLFPGTPALQEQSKIVTVGHAPTGIRSRLTLTLGVLNRAAVILFLVTGPGKAEMVRRVVESESAADRSLPAARISPESGRLVWMLDQAAAQQLTQERSQREGT
ncbi:MAG: 6-phosphogluconolactonase [Nitrospira sp. LK70]|nr:6-phosphogluconolactonase [Nitrospira sp. LK70]